MSLFKRRERSVGQPPPRPAPQRHAGNMLPHDNVYLKAALQANADFTSNGWQVRVAAVRMETPGELEVALVVPGEEAGAIRSALEALPGPEPVLAVVLTHLRRFGHSVAGSYFSEAMWRDAQHDSTWRYDG